MVGRSLVSALARDPRCRGMRVALVLGHAPTVPGPSPSPRVVAISPASESWLKRCGAWNMIEESQRKEFRSMIVADACSPQAKVCLEARGTVVEVDAITEAMSLASKVATGGAQVEWIWNKAMKDLHLPPLRDEERGLGDGLAKVHLESGKILRTRLVVGADGAQSRVRELSGLNMRSFSHGQRAVCCVVTTSRDHNTAWQRFLPSGPIAVLPMKEGNSCIVWSIDADEARQIEKLSDEEFIVRVNEALHSKEFYSDFEGLMGLGNWLSYGRRHTARASDSTSTVRNEKTKPGNTNDSDDQSWSSPAESKDNDVSSDERHEFPKVISLASRPKSFPLRTGQSTRFTLPRLALAGDAAHIMHPLAGQGVNMGFGDTELLLELMVGASEGGEDLGGQRLLKEYARRRRAANLAMSATVEGVKLLFAAQGGLATTARLFGMSMVDSMPFLKKEMVEFASGTKKW